MTTEEKIKEIVEECEDLTRGFTEKRIEDLIREEKIKILEGLKYSVPFSTKDGDVYDSFNHGQDSGKKQFMQKIADLISELREEGKEKGRL